MDEQMIFEIAKAIWLEEENRARVAIDLPRLSEVLSEAAWSKRLPAAIAAHSVIAGKVAELEAALIEARVYVEKYGQQNAETGTQLQAMIVALLAKIDAALAPYPERRHD